jgi:Na+/H+ antiporter NhaC
MNDHGSAEQEPDDTDVQQYRVEKDVTIEFHGGKWLSTVPLFFFVLWAIVQSAIFQIGAADGLIVGALLGLILGMFFVKGPWKTYANTIFEGMTQRVAATAIVAWLWAGMFAETIKVGGFVGGLVWLATTVGVGQVLFPAVSFLLAALLATGIGTGYGTTITFVTLFYPAGLVLGADPVLLFGAILSGAVFGDNLAPVSDTTIVSAVTQESDIGGVVASRFKYAVIAAAAALTLYVLFGLFGSEGLTISEGAQNLLQDESNALGLLHLVSMGVVIVTAVMGCHIVEAISWGILTACGFNLVTGLAPVSDMLVFNVSEQLGYASDIAFLPFVEVVSAGSEGLGGSLYEGVIGFFPLSILVLLIVASAQIMIRGGGFQAIQSFLLNYVARTVRSAETTLVAGTALVNGMITINTAAEIAIAPYVSNIGKRFNINGYRRANILDANTAALGYIFPWSGGVLVGYAQMNGLAGTYDWFDPQTMIVNPIEVWPYVFHGWFLVAVFLFAAWTGFGREYTTDRASEEVSRV